MADNTDFWSDVDNVSAQPRVAGDDFWADVDKKPQQIQQEDKRTLAEKTGDYIGDKWQDFKEFAQPGEEVIQERREGAKGIAGEAAGGLVRAASGLEKLVAGYAENVYDVGRVIGREGMKLVTGTPETEMAPFERTNYFTENLQQAEDELLEKVLPEEQDRTKVGKIVGKVAEYAAPTAGMTRLYMSWGDDLLKGTAKLSENKIKRSFQESMMAAAKNPKAAHKLEQTVSGMMATVGQTLENEGFSPGAQITGEIVTGILSGSIINSAKSITDSYKRFFTAKGKDKLASKGAQNYLKTIADADPQFQDKLKRGLELQEETGVKMDLGQLTDNPELKAALHSLRKSAGDDTTFNNMLAESTRKVKEFAEPDIRLQEEGLSAFQKQRDSELAYLEEKAKGSVEGLVRQIDEAAPADRIQMGETGREMIQTAKESANKKVSALYDDVGNPTIHTDKMEDALKAAKKESGLIGDDYMNELDAELRNVLEKNILPGETKAPFSLGQGLTARPKVEEAKTLTLQQARILESRLKERIRAANAAGETNKSRVLNNILDGIYDQYDTAVGETAENIAKLRYAASESKRFHKTFNQGEVLMSTKVDKQGIYKISNEGFIRNFIKANSDSKGAVEKPVKDFFEAYGNVPEAKKWMANSFGTLLKDKFPNIENENPQKVMNFINQHSRFLKEAGIDKRFSTLKKSITEARSANEAVSIDAKQFKESIVGKFLNADNPRQVVMNSIGTPKIGQLMKKANAIPDKGRRELVKASIREMAWDSVFNQLKASRKASGEVLLDTATVRKALDDKRYRKSLEQVLGKDHTKRLDTLLDTVDRIKDAPSSTYGDIFHAVDENLTEKLMTGLRAAAHGFVRPDLIAAQMAKRGYNAYTLKNAQNVLKNALEDPVFAQKLLQLEKTKEGRRIVKTLFSPLVNPVITDREETE